MNFPSTFPAQRLRRWLRYTLYILLASALIGVFWLYFRPGLIMDLANFLWRCA